MSDTIFTTTDPDIRENTVYLFALMRHTVNTTPHSALQQLPMFLNLELDLKATDYIDTGKGNTLLITAASRGHRDTAINLLDIGADINAADINGLTALYQACRFDFSNNLPPGPSIAQILIERGADVEAAGEGLYGDRENALAGGLLAKEPGIVRLLLSAGASLPAGETIYDENSEKEPWNNTALERCARYKDVWEDKLNRFRTGTYTPSTREDWNHLASVIPLEDPHHAPSAADRRKMLEDMRPDISLGKTRKMAMHLHTQGAVL